MSVAVGSQHTHLRLAHDASRWEPVLSLSKGIYVWKLISWQESCFSVFDIITKYSIIILFSHTNTMAASGTLMPDQNTQDDESLLVDAETLLALSQETEREGTKRRRLGTLERLRRFDYDRILRGEEGGML